MLCNKHIARTFQTLIPLLGCTATLARSLIKPKFLLKNTAIEKAQMPNISKLTAACVFLFVRVAVRKSCLFHSFVIVRFEGMSVIFKHFETSVTKNLSECCFRRDDIFLFLMLICCVCVCSIVCLRIIQSGDFPILISRWKLSKQSHSCQIIASSNKQVELQATSNEQLRELHYARILKETIAFLLAANSFEVVHFQEAEIFWRERNSTITDKIHSFSFRLRNSVNKKCFEQKNF